MCSFEQNLLVSWQRKQKETAGVVAICKVLYIATDEEGFKLKEKDENWIIFSLI